MIEGVGPKKSHIIDIGARSHFLPVALKILKNAQAAQGRKPSHVSALTRRHSYRPSRKGLGITAFFAKMTGIRWGERTALPQRNGFGVRVLLTGVGRHCTASLFERRARG